MPGEIDPEYVAARRALLDAFDAMENHLESIVLVGAQAIYLHTGEGDLATSVFTTDGDLSIDPRTLADSPLLDRLLVDAGFARHDEVGRWTSPDGVYIDLMVPFGLLGIRAVGVSTSHRTRRTPSAGPRVSRVRASSVRS